MGRGRAAGRGPSTPLSARPTSPSRAPSRSLSPSRGRMTLPSGPPSSERGASHEQTRTVGHLPCHAAFVGGPGGRVWRGWHQHVLQGPGGARRRQVALVGGIRGAHVLGNVVDREEGWNDQLLGRGAAGEVHRLERGPRLHQRNPPGYESASRREGGGL